MKILFEDGKSSAISKLLASSWFGSQMEFCGGVNNISKRLTDNKALYAVEDFILIFVDVVPDNPSSLSSFNEIHAAMKEVKGVKYKETSMIVPIFCIEYFVLLYINWFLKIPELSLFLTDFITPFGLIPYDKIEDEAGKILVRKK